MNPMKSEHVVRSHLSAAQVVAEWLAYRPAFPLVGLDRVFQGKDWRWGSKYPPGAPVPPKRCGATVIPLDILPQESESGALHGRGRTRPRNAGAEPNPMCLRVRILRVGWMIPETPPRIVSRRDRSFGVDRAHHPSPLLRCIRVRARARGMRPCGGHVGVPRRAGPLWGRNGEPGAFPVPARFHSECMRTGRSTWIAPAGRQV